MNDRGHRTSILQNLATKLATRIPDADSVLIAAQHMVSACDDHDGGIEALIEAVRYIEGRTRAMRAIDAWADAWANEQANEQANDARAASVAESRDQPEPEPAPEPEPEPAPEPDSNSGNAAPSFPIVSLPVELTRCFTGREELLSRLHESFAAHRPVALVQAVSGLGGVGKSQLARRYADLHQDDFDVIWWLRAEHSGTLADDIMALARKLGLGINNNATVEPSIVTRYVKRWLGETDKRWLLIFDNVEDPAIVRPMLSGLRTGKHARGCALMTSRNHNLGDLATVHLVNVFEPSEARRFLLDRTGQTDETAADELANELGHLPLALVQAAAYMVERETPLATYHEYFRKHRHALWQREAAPLDYHATVSTTWVLNISQVSERAPNAVQLMNLLAFLAPDRIPVHLLADSAEVLPDALAAAVAHDLDREDLIRALLRYSLIARDSKHGVDTLSVHRLVQNVVRDQLNAAEAEHWAHAALEAVNAAFSFDQRDMKTWPPSERLVPHAQAVLASSTGPDAESLLAAELWRKLGGYLHHRADYAEAQRALTRALKICEARQGPEHVYTARALYDLGHSLIGSGEYQSARDHLEQALAIADMSDEMSLGPEYLDTAAVLRSLGEVLQALGDYEAAQRHAQRALDICEASRDPEHPSTAHALNTLGILLQRRGDHEAARGYLERARGIYAACLDPEHPDIASVLQALAQVARSQGHHEQARADQEQVVAILEKSQGPEHPETGTALHNLGGMLFDHGKWVPAQRHLERALRICEKNFADDHPDLVPTLTLLGQIQYACKRPEQGRLYLRRALDICTRGKAMHEHHQELLAVLSSLRINPRTLSRGTPSKGRSRKSSKRPKPRRKR